MKTGEQATLDITRWGGPTDQPFRAGLLACEQTLLLESLANIAHLTYDSDYGYGEKYAPCSW